MPNLGYYTAVCHVLLTCMSPAALTCMSRAAHMYAHSPCQKVCCTERRHSQPAILLLVVPGPAYGKQQLQSLVLVYSVFLHVSLHANMQSLELRRGMPIKHMIHTSGTGLDSSASCMASSSSGDCCFTRAWCFCRPKVHSTSVDNCECRHAYIAKRVQMYHACSEPRSPKGGALSFHMCWGRGDCTACCERVAAKVILPNCAVFFPASASDSTNAPLRLKLNLSAVKTGGTFPCARKADAVGCGPQRGCRTSTHVRTMHA